MHASMLAEGFKHMVLLDTTSCHARITGYELDTGYTDGLMCNKARYLC